MNHLSLVITPLISHQNIWSHQLVKCEKLWKELNWFNIKFISQKRSVYNGHGMMHFCPSIMSFREYTITALGSITHRTVVLQHVCHQLKGQFIQNWQFCHHLLIHGIWMLHNCQTKSKYTNFTMIWYFLHSVVSIHTVYCPVVWNYAV